MDTNSYELDNSEYSKQSDDVSIYRSSKFHSTLSSLKYDISNDHMKDMEQAFRQMQLYLDIFKKERKKLNNVKED